MKNFKMTGVQRLMLGGLIVAAIYFLLYQYVDLPTAVYLETYLPPALEQISRYFSLIATPKIWMALSLLGFIYFALCNVKNKFNNLVRDILLLSSSVFIAQSIGSVLKYAIGRARPILYFNDHIYGFHFLTNDKIFHSSPSGHTLTIFALAAMASILHRRFAPLFFTIAVLVGTSRVLLTEHYISDVLFGAYFGIVCAFFAHYSLQGYVKNSATPRS